MEPSREEQACRRKAMRDALTNAHLEGLEPDPIFFEYVERYAHGELTLAEILADYRERIIAGMHASLQAAQAAFAASRP